LCPAAALNETAHWIAHQLESRLYLQSGFHTVWAHWSHSCESLELVLTARSGPYHQKIKRPFRATGKETSREACHQLGKFTYHLGGLAFGVFSFGGASVGLASVGGPAIGIVSLGGAAIGLLAAVGGVAIGYNAVGVQLLAFDFLKIRKF
jgi:hypothetical protein